MKLIKQLSFLMGLNVLNINMEMLHVMFLPQKFIHLTGLCFIFMAVLLLVVLEWLTEVFVLLWPLNVIAVL